MEVGFYEEFPSKKNLNKLKLISFPTRIFIAEKSLKEFKKWENYVKKINKKTKCGYWPIIKNSYWISPFSNTKDLQETFNELSKLKNKLLIDLELPFLNRKMFLKNFLKFPKNKKLIKEFIEKNKKRIVTAEYPSSIFSIFTKILGINYKIKTEKSIMWYSSMFSEKLNNKIKENLPKLKNKKQYSISLGTIAKGILGNEPIISPENLEKDLEFVKKAGFNKVIIFRLEGLNKNYLKVLKEFVKV